MKLFWKNKLYSYSIDECTEEEIDNTECEEAIKVFKTIKNKYRIK